MFQLLRSSLRLGTFRNAVRFNSSLSVSSTNQGLASTTISLPQRGQTKFFISSSQTLGHFYDDIKSEDAKVSHVRIYDSEGLGLSNSTPFSALLNQDLKLAINDDVYDVQLSDQHFTGDDNAAAPTSFNTRVFELVNVLQRREDERRALKMELSDLEEILVPLETKRVELEQRANRRAKMMAWGMFGFLGLQWGFLARLTWWEYSWDLMEPVTYFIGTGAQLVAMGYYILTQREYNEEVVQNRRELKSFYRMAQSNGISVEDYNKMKARAEEIRQRLTSS